MTLQEQFGWDGFRSGQRPVIEALLEGRDALAVLPTGGGKSLCYQLPALVRQGLVPKQREQVLSKELGTLAVELAQ